MMWKEIQEGKEWTKTKYHFQDLGTTSSWVLHAVDHGKGFEVSQSSASIDNDLSSVEEQSSKNSTANDDSSYSDDVSFEDSHLVFDIVEAVASLTMLSSSTTSIITNTKLPTPSLTEDPLYSTTVSVSGFLFNECFLSLIVT